MSGLEKNSHKYTRVGTYHYHKETPEWFVVCIILGNLGSIWLHEWFRCLEKILITEYGVIYHLVVTLVETSWQHHRCQNYRARYQQHESSGAASPKEQKMDFATILCDRRTDLVAAFYPSKREGIRGPHRDYFSLLPGWHRREWVDGNCCYLIDLEATLDQHPA